MRLYEFQKGYFDDSKKMSWVNNLVSKISVAMDSAFKSGQLVLPPNPNQKSSGEPEPKTGAKPGQQQTPSKPQTPAQVRQQKIAAATGAVLPQQQTNIVAKQNVRQVKESKVLLYEQGQMSIDDFIFSLIMKHTEGILSNDPKQVAIIKQLAGKIDNIYKTTKNPQDIMGYLRVIAGIAYEVLEKRSEKVGKQVAGVGDNQLDTREKLRVNSIISATRALDPQGLSIVKKSVDDEYRKIPQK